MKRVALAIAVDCFFAGVATWILIASIGNTIENAKRRRRARGC